MNLKTGYLLDCFLAIGYLFLHYHFLSLKAVGLQTNIIVNNNFFALKKPIYKNGCAQKSFHRLFKSSIEFFCLIPEGFVLKVYETDSFSSFVN